MKYYGLKYKEVLELGTEEGNMLWNSITVFEAREMLVQMKVADYPNMKQPDREKLHRSIYEEAYPRMRENMKPLSTQEIAGLLSRG